MNDVETIRRRMAGLKLSEQKVSLPSKTAVQNSVDVIKRRMAQLSTPGLGVQFPLTTSVTQPVAAQPTEEYPQALGYKAPLKGVTEWITRKLGMPSYTTAQTSRMSPLQAGIIGTEVVSRGPIGKAAEVGELVLAHPARAIAAIAGKDMPFQWWYTWDDFTKDIGVTGKKGIAMSMALGILADPTTWIGVGGLGKFLKGLRGMKFGGELLTDAGTRAMVRFTQEATEDALFKGLNVTEKEVAQQIAEQAGEKLWKAMQSDPSLYVKPGITVGIPGTKLEKTFGGKLPEVAKGALTPTVKGESVMPRIMAEVKPAAINTLEAAKSWRAVEEATKRAVSEMPKVSEQALRQGRIVQSIADFNDAAKTGSYSPIVTTPELVKALDKVKGVDVFQPVAPKVYGFQKGKIVTILDDTNKPVEHIIEDVTPDGWAVRNMATNEHFTATTEELIDKTASATQEKILDDMFEKVRRGEQVPQPIKTMVDAQNARAANAVVKPAKEQLKELGKQRTYTAEMMDAVRKKYHKAVRTASSDFLKEQAATTTRQVKDLEREVKDITARLDKAKALRDELEATLPKPSSVTGEISEAEKQAADIQKELKGLDVVEARAVIARRQAPVFRQGRHLDTLESIRQSKQELESQLEKAQNRLRSLRETPAAREAVEKQIRSLTGEIVDANMKLKEKTALLYESKASLNQISATLKQPAKLSGITTPEASALFSRVVELRRRLADIDDQIGIAERQTRMFGEIPKVTAEAEQKAIVKANKLLKKMTKLEFQKEGIIPLATEKGMLPRQRFTFTDEAKKALSADKQKVVRKEAERHMKRQLGLDRKGTRFNPAKTTVESGYYKWHVSRIGDKLDITGEVKQGGKWASYGEPVEIVLNPGEKADMELLFEGYNYLPMDAQRAFLDMFKTAHPRFDTVYLPAIPKASSVADIAITRELPVRDVFRERLAEFMGNNADKLDEMDTDKLLDTIAQGFGEFR